MGSLSYQIDSNVTGRAEALRYAREVCRGTIVDHAYGAGDGRGRGSYGWGGVLYVVEEHVRDGETVRRASLFLFSVYADRQWGGSCTREFVVKSEDESMGPYRYDCPKRLLNKLTPTESTYAQEWRAGVERFHEARKAARAVVGKTIRLSSSLNYGSAGEVDTVVVLSMNLWRMAQSPGMRLRPPTQWWLRTYRVLEDGAESIAS